MQKLLDLISKKPRVAFAIMLVLLLIVIIMLAVYAILGSAKAIDEPTLKMWWKAKMNGSSSFTPGKVWGDRAALTDNTLSAGASNFVAGRTEQPMITTTDKYMAQAVSQAAQGLMGPTSYDESGSGGNLGYLQAKQPMVSPSNSSSMTDRKLMRQDSTVVVS